MEWLRMKLKKLKFKNFGFFINEIVDFLWLIEVLFFLISGKIGVGKMMIFDGIIFVFFGEIFGRFCFGKEMCFLFVILEEEISVIFFFEY